MNKCSQHTEQRFAIVTQHTQQSRPHPSALTRRSTQSSATDDTEAEGRRGGVNRVGSASLRCGRESEGYSLGPFERKALVEETIAVHVHTLSPVVIQ
jgi:hypothetical protein